MKITVLLISLSLTSTAVLAEELTLPKFSDEVMSQGSEDYKPGCQYTEDPQTGERTSQCTLDGDGDVTDYTEADVIGPNYSNGMGRQDGITSDYANQKIRDYSAGGRR